MDVSTVPVSGLRLDPNNARRHGPANLSAIAGSLSSFGQRRPLVVRGDLVIAGNGTLEAAKSLGWTEILVTQVPDDWSDDQAKAYALADNRTAELADWDMQVLTEQLQQLQAVEFDLPSIGFDDWAAQITPTLDDDDPDGYTDKVTNLIYEITGDRPEVTDLMNGVKTGQLHADIIASDLPDDLQSFLLAAATRHIVFNYSLIAEYYAHADVDVQRLFEASALVIIDYENAIRDGYVRVTDAIDKLQKADER
jgi:hypothetical protein